MGSWFLFTREITLNNKYLSQYFPERKVLLMTLEELFKIFIKVLMFDCMTVIFKKLCANFAICATFGVIWVRNGPDIFFRGQIESIKSLGSTS